MKEGSSSVCAMEHHSTASTIHGGAESDFREKKLTTWWEGEEWRPVRAQSAGGPFDPRSVPSVQLVDKKSGRDGPDHIGS